MSAFNKREFMKVEKISRLHEWVLVDSGSRNSGSAVLAFSRPRDLRCDNFSQRLICLFDETGSITVIFININ